MAKELPKKHTPRSLRPPTVVTYAIGYEHKPNSFGMTHGPTLSLGAMLDVVPDPDPAGACSCIIRFNTDGTDDVLYRWSESEESWVLESCFDK